MRCGVICHTSNYALYLCSRNEKQNEMLGNSAILPVMHSTFVQEMRNRMRCGVIVPYFQLCTLLAFKK